MATIRTPLHDRQNAQCEPMTRLQVANTLKQAVVGYYAHLGFSCYEELGVVPWGKRRLDVFALNMKGTYIGVEVKSCLADYATDGKWTEYLEHVNKFYFCFSQRMYDKHQKRLKADCAEHGAGIMVLCEKSGRIRVVRNATRRTMDKQNKLRLLLKTAWRGGKSKRTHKRRTRLYLT